jgi:hypothetical protein
MEYFALLADDAAAALALAGIPSRAEILPEAYAHAEAGGLHIRCRFYAVPGRGELRSAYITSPKIEIINCFFFPEPGSPLYAMELVVLGRQPQVGVMDAFYLLPDAAPESKLRDMMQQCRRAYADLPQADDAPEWYAACRSGLDFFVRPRSEAELLRLIQAHRQLWQEFTGLLRLPAITPQAEAHRTALAAYQRHHRDYTPGLKLLQNRFGADWTQGFLGFFFGG